MGADPDIASLDQSIIATLAQNAKADFESAQMGAEQPTLPSRVAFESWVNDQEQGRDLTLFEIWKAEYAKLGGSSTVHGEDVWDAVLDAARKLP